MTGLSIFEPKNLASDVALNRFIETTNATSVDQRFLERFESVTGQKPHRYLRRGIVSCHRDLDKILDKSEKQEPFYIFTGRGPSSDSLHIGHSIPFEFTKWLQDVFQVPLIIMLTDDMKLLHSQKLDFESVARYTSDNAKDILAFGFNPASTFMFSNLDFVGGAFYRNIVSIARLIRVSDIKNALGFTDAENVGMFYCCSTQSAGTFATSFPGILGDDVEKLRGMQALIPCSYDIDGYFSEVRKKAAGLGFAPAAFAYSSLLPALGGVEGKMSASILSSAIYLTDSPSQIEAKLAAGEAKLDVDAVFTYLRFFLEDDEELRVIEERYGFGELSVEDTVPVLVRVLQGLVSKFQASRAKIDEETLKRFMEPRLLQ
ncbi:tryptophanyl-tRNA synthetase [Cucurbitaria berberidis CBS 394.84]|uniref:Tryptophanyl-tRNA synthetase n=1 Tax=Cucurbitaria berberidis CBS 394.84 TaxID=1168544 RepID=A0A9P4GF37_9PLEO|nr:tryptophanyl-tRNA synthetase [Cucurbitaria berberidis CBS 394.84]KAF1844289.1 tryptophanyl-tRNA synthetase [Cucurbitaria berberidis CBS 394.84]